VPSKIKALRAKLGQQPSYRLLRGKYFRQSDDFSTGRPPKDPKMAWWALPKKAKKLLDEMREAGQFGGKAGQAPYWLIQEKGLGEVGIQSLQYLKSSVDEWELSIRNDVRQWVGGYSPAEQSRW